MTLKPIEMGKEYRLANGWEYRLYAVDGGGKYPVHGAYFDPDHKVWVRCGHTTYGNYSLSGSSPDLDLVEPPKRLKREWWVNEFPGNNAVFYRTKLEADVDQTKGIWTRIACKHITYEFEEGEGLSGEQHEEK